MKAPQRSLNKWTKEKWGTKSGKNSTQGSKATGERYLPKAAREALSSSEYAATSAAKRKGKASGKQFVKQPKKIAEKTAKFRANEGGLAVKKKMGYNKGGVPSFKACADCPSPAKCAKQGCQKAKTKMAKGGVAKKPMSKGMKALKKAAPAVAKRMGYKKGGYVACGASNPGTQKRSTK